MKKVISIFVVVLLLLSCAPRRLKCGPRRCDMNTIKHEIAINKRLAQANINKDKRYPTTIKNNYFSPYEKNTIHSINISVA